MSWGDLHIAVVGGDEREQEIARLAALEAGRVTAYGFPWPEGGVDGVARAGTPAEALRGASYALFPVPGIATDGSLFAPATTDPIVPHAALLGELAPGATVILGAADERLRAAAGAAGVDLVEYEHDSELMMLRAPAIVEGALELAIAHTDVTIHAAEVAVVGHGNIGALLARTLAALGARVTVAARNPAQRAAAHASGTAVASLDDLPSLAPRLAMVFSTVPAPVVGTEVLLALPPGSLVMDLAAPPGGVDLQAARELGHTAVWARGLGRRAPVTVGASQWSGIRRRIETIEARHHPGRLG
jgi:dipicolinate synthase subunit A